MDHESLKGDYFVSFKIDLAAYREALAVSKCQKFKCSQSTVERQISSLREKSCKQLFEMPPEASMGTFIVDGRAFPCKGAIGGFRVVRCTEAGDSALVTLGPVDLRPSHLELWRDGAKLALPDFSDLPPPSPPPPPSAPSPSSTPGPRRHR